MSSIRVSDLSIRFRAYHDRALSLKGYIANALKRKERSTYSEFPALSHVSFQIAGGERVGIVGHNGAGKSTLLKALCRIYEPSSGQILVDGRIAPLLEIGAGFHPEFTGRENLYFNGAILGYTQSQLKEIEPEVIAFSELADFIDTPVKYYSTGMYMRLAFSLATAMHPDILVLDEIFAGGDASFVVRAQERMRALVSRANIMIMVSHSHDLVRSLCNRVLWIDHGKLVADGSPDDVIGQYLDAARRGGP